MYSCSCSKSINNTKSYFFFYLFLFIEHYGQRGKLRQAQYTNRGVIFFTEHRQGQKAEVITTYRLRLIISDWLK